MLRLQGSHLEPATLRALRDRGVRLHLVDTHDDAGRPVPTFADVTDVDLIHTLAELGCFQVYASSPPREDLHFFAHETGQTE